MDLQGFSLKALRHLVLDEADRLLNMDFEQEIDQILKSVPRDRRTQLFSATMTSKARALSALHPLSSGPHAASSVYIKSRVTAACITFGGRSWALSTVLLCRYKSCSERACKTLSRWRYLQSTPPWTPSGSNTCSFPPSTRCVLVRRCCAAGREANDRSTDVGPVSLRQSSHAAHL